MEICIVGGSNSVIKEGYIHYMAASLSADHDLYVSSITNLAVGGTSVFTGLARLIKTGAHKSADLMIIEYSLNDSVFNNAQGFFDLWGEAYEGLIRKAITDNPFLTIVPIILGRSNGVYRRRICPISSGVHTIARRYSLNPLDVNELLMERYPGQEDYEKLYADVSHYARPGPAREIGLAVAEHIAKFCIKPWRAVSIGSIRPIYAKNLSSAKYMSKFKDVHRTAQKKTYQNSIFNSETTFFTPKSIISMILTGRVHLIEFVSTPSSSDIQIKLNNHHFRQHTTRKTFLGSKMPFLLGAVLPDYHAKQSVKGLKASLEIEVLENGDAGEEYADKGVDAGAEAAGPLRSPINNIKPGFSLEGILYSGLLKVQ